MARKVICDQIFGFIFIVLVVNQVGFTTTQVTGVPKFPFHISPALSPPQNETGIQSVVIKPQTRLIPLSPYGQTQTQFGASAPKAQPQPHIQRPYVAAPSSAPPHGASSQQEPMINTEKGFVTHQDLVAEQKSPNSQQDHPVQYKYQQQQVDLQVPLSVQQYAVPSSEATANQPPIYQQYQQPPFAPLIQHLFQDKYHTQQFPAQDPLSVESSQQYPPPAIQPPISQQYPEPPFASADQPHIQTYPRTPTNQQYPQPLFQDKYYQQFSPHELLSAFANQQYPQQPEALTANQQHASQQYPQPQPPSPPQINHWPTMQQFPRPSANQRYLQLPPQTAASANQPPASQQYPQPPATSAYRPPTSQQYPQPSQQHTKPPLISANQPPANQQAQFEAVSANQPRFPNASNQSQTLALVSKNATRFLTPNQLNTIEVPSAKIHQTRPGRVQVVYIPGNRQRPDMSTMGYFRVIHVSLPSLPKQNTRIAVTSITPDSKNINKEPRTNHQNSTQANPTVKPLTAIDRYFGVTSSITPSTKSISFGLQNRKNELADGQRLDTSYQKSGVQFGSNLNAMQHRKPTAGGQTNQSSIDVIAKNRHGQTSETSYQRSGDQMGSNLNTVQHQKAQKSTNKLTDGQRLETSFQRSGVQPRSNLNAVQHMKPTARGQTNQSSIDVIVKDRHGQTSETSYQRSGAQLGSNTVQHQKPIAGGITNYSSIEAIANNTYESTPKIQIPSSIEKEKSTVSVEIGPNRIPLDRTNTSSKYASNFLRRFTKPSEKNHGSRYTDFTRLQQPQKVVDQPPAYFRRWNGHEDPSQLQRKDRMGIYMDFTKSQLNKPLEEIPVANLPAEFARSRGNNELNIRNTYSMFTALMERKMNTTQTIGNPTGALEGQAQASSSTSRSQGQGTGFAPLLQPSSTHAHTVGLQSSPTALNTPQGGKLMISNSMLQQIMTDYSAKKNNKSMSLNSNRPKPTILSPITGIDVPGLNSTHQQIMPDYTVRITDKSMPLNQHHPKQKALSSTTSQETHRSNSTLQKIMTDQSAQNNSQHFPQAIVHSSIHRIDMPVSSRASISSYEVPLSAKIPTIIQNIKMPNNQAKQNHRALDVPASSIRRVDMHGSSQTSISPYEVPVSAKIPTTLKNKAMVNNQAQRSHQFADVPGLNPSQHITERNPYYAKYGHIISREQGAVPVPRVHSVILDRPLPAIPRFPGPSQIQETQHAAQGTKTVIPTHKLQKQFTLDVHKSKGTANNTHPEAASTTPFQKIILSGRISLNAKSPVVSPQSSHAVQVSGTGNPGSGANLSTYHTSQLHSSQPQYPLDAIPRSPVGQVMDNSMGSPLDFRHRGQMLVGQIEQQSHSISGNSLYSSAPLGHAPGPIGPLFPQPNPYGHLPPVGPTFNHGQVNQMSHQHAGSFGQSIHPVQPTQHNPGTVDQPSGLFGQPRYPVQPVQHNSGTVKRKGGSFGQPRHPGQPMQRNPGTVKRNGGSFGLPFQPMQHNTGTVGRTGGSFGQPRHPVQPMQHNPSTVQREGGSFGQPRHPGQPMQRNPGTVRRNGRSFGLSLLPVQPMQKNPAPVNALFAPPKSVYPQLQAPLSGLANSPALAPIGTGALQPNITLTHSATASAPIFSIWSTTVAPGPTFNPDLQCAMQSECEVGCCYDATGDILWDWKSMINPTITPVGFCHVKEETTLDVSCHDVHCPCTGGDQVCVSIPPRNFTMPPGYDPAEHGVISFGKCRTAGQPVAGIGHLEKAKAMMDMCMLDPACPLYQPMKKK